MAIAIYARRSVESDKSISCDTQVEYCKAMIRPEEREEKVLTFIDNGYSGGNLDRVGYQRMMKLVEKNKINKILVYRLDRISRSLADFVDILAVLKRHNVQFVSSQESFDTSSTYGEMIAKLLAVFAEFERSSIIERTRQAFKHRSELGLFMGGRLPYGFTTRSTEIRGIPTKMLEVDEEAMAHVKLMFDTYSVPGVSLRRVMDNLIMQGFRPPEGEWSTSKISTILKNPIYVRADASIYEYYNNKNANIISDISEFDEIHGIQLYGVSKHTADDFSDIKVIVMKHEGVISSDVWLACQRKLVKNKQINNSLSNQTSWLGGSIYCSKCQRKMTVTRGAVRVDGTSQRYFSCIGRAHRFCTGAKVTLYADSLEQMMDELISEKLSTIRNYRRVTTNDNSAKLNQLKAKLLEIQTAQERLADLVMADGLEADMLALLNAKAKKLAEEKREVNEKVEAIKATESEVQSVLNLTLEWSRATYDEKKAVVHLLVDKILIAEDGSVEVVWNI